MLVDATCLEDTTSTANVAMPPSEERPLLERGQLVGRYVILQPLGRGGMGVVYKAYDPKLERHVALKLLRTPGAGGEALRPRLLREAQALAQLAHPNVVAVHDVGTVGDDVFVAMEFVEGRTLREWLWREGRRPGEIVEVFRAAGEGLSAAHRAGIVHRDFKPDNVIVGDDGRVRVLDFGLAVAQIVPSGANDALARPSSDASGSTLTGVGAVVGTPRYMAPEQHAGAAVDERADQFGFCVSLFEALYGVPPFAGATTAALRDAMERGRVAPAPVGKSLPRWLRRVLLRGLAAAPSQRFPSMPALLEALAADPRLKVQRWARLAGVLALGASVAAAALAWRSRHDERKLACAGAAARLEGVWDDARRAAVRASFTSTATPYAAAVLRAVERTFDEYARGWAAMHRDACEATRLRGEQSEDVLDLRMTCLDDRRAHLQAMAVLFAQGGEKVIERAVTSAQALPPVDGCADLAALRAPVPPPKDPETRRRVSAVRETLARVSALELSGAYDEAIALAKGAVTDAKTLAYSPIFAEAALHLGQVSQARGEWAKAQRDLFDAYVAAIAGKHDEAAARASIDLLTTSSQQGHFDEGDRWASVAEASLERLTRRDDLRGVWMTQRSRLRTLESRYDEALSDAKAAVATLEHSSAADDLRLAMAYDYLGQVHFDRGNYAEALEAYARSSAIADPVLGPDHPRAFVHWINAANVYGDSGDHTRAIAAYERGLAVLTRLNPSHPDIAAVYNNMGEELLALGRLEEAKAVVQQAYERWSATLGPSWATATALLNLGKVHSALGQLEEARACYEKALAMGEEVLGPTHRRIADALEGLGDTCLRQGKLDDALAYYRRAVALGERTLGATHIGLTTHLFGLARVHVARHELDAAVPLFERALAIRTSQPSDGRELAGIRFGLARVLAVRGEKDRATELATQARDAYARLGAVGATDRAAVETWLAQRR